jgi:DNA-binding transcriptional MerR regulator
MKPDSSPHSPDLPVYEDDIDARYTVEVIAELAGIDSTTLLRYQEKGFIRPVGSTARDSALFDAECLRQLRRIEHLRATCDMNDTGLKLVLDLMHELEILRQERRQAGR